MFKTVLYKHFNKNFINYITSNFVFLKKNLVLNNYVKFFFFYNNHNFYLSFFILFNFWINNLSFFLKKNKFTILINQLNFFLIFSLFFYPFFIINKLFIYDEIKQVFYFTFLINRFFFNPLLVFFNNKFRIRPKKIHNLLKVALLLKKDQFFFIHFYLNFFQFPVFNFINISE